MVKTQREIHFINDCNAIVIACEESQRVCTAFRERGHEAYSCDIIDQSGSLRR